MEKSFCSLPEYAIITSTVYDEAIKCFKIVIFMFLRGDHLFYKSVPNSIVLRLRAKKKLFSH